MKLYFVLALLFLSTFIYSQPSQPSQSHNLFHFWDMDKWGNYRPVPDGSKHDMDYRLKIDFVDDANYLDYSWKLTLRNSTGTISYSTAAIKCTTYTIIKPRWKKADGTLSFTPAANNIVMDYSFEPAEFDVSFFDENYVELGDEWPISNQTIDINNIYLWDHYNYYDSDIKTISASVDPTSFDINLYPTILQPEWFYLTVKVNDTLSRQ